jgi:tRNA uridine 5-carbamoylmethylation protein Kti12
MPVAVVCVIGLPGAGKSSLCDFLSSSELFQERFRLWSCTKSVRTIVLSFDAYENSLRESFGEGIKVFDPEIWRRTRIDFERDLSEMRRNCELESNVMTLIFVDDNLHYKSMRKRFRPNGILFLSRDVKECMYFNSLRAQRVPDSIIERMAVLFEVPQSKSTCPVLVLSPPMKSSKEDVGLIVMDDNRFWISVIESSLVSSASLGIPKQPTISHRTVLLNNFETRLRASVSRFVAAKPVNCQFMKRITILKASHMKNLKFKLDKDIALKVDIDELISQFVVELAHLT